MGVLVGIGQLARPVLREFCAARLGFIKRTRNRETTRDQGTGS